jgi:hypothetical protein
MKFFVVALILTAVVPAGAHHPFTPYYDASELVSVAGVVVEFRVVNPHVALIVDGTLSGGPAGRWAFGLPAQRIREIRCGRLQRSAPPGHADHDLGMAGEGSRSAGRQRARGHIREWVDDALRADTGGGGPLELRARTVPVHIPRSVIELISLGSGRESLLFSRLAPT